MQARQGTSAGDPARLAGAPAPTPSSASGSSAPAGSQGMEWSAGTGQLVERGNNTDEHRRNDLGLILLTAGGREDKEG